MNRTESIGMDAGERDSFLGIGGTGVISVPRSDDSPPHSVPVSYGYDRSETTFYFRLAVGSDSAKQDAGGSSVTFVVYGQEGGAWQSVVVTGRLEETSEASVATGSLEGLQRVHIPLVDIFGRPTKDVPFGFYRLVPDEITARKESSDPQ
ncbi:hypothetical protein GCM10008995_03640 [Halobellus salinus]|uniref:Pyridoxamine 5'-phosphate oxidase family protein n=1 Tax=Halobellus salinus TaxID=931585 RepID=A0A830EK53_9EURY|nr:pyridoxamine 5'-phosphate oxidase family protein [Halobellus salinus]GGI96899.1 hypothetical protein GCM10008995_03640 [Halobellus salinus]SMP13583.1 hypothetical protein SAMN06265347_104213 [Halobellus salinus]